MLPRSCTESDVVMLMRVCFIGYRLPFAVDGWRIGAQCRFPQQWHSQPPESRTLPAWTYDFVAQFEQVTLIGFVHPPALGDDLTGTSLSFARSGRGRL